MLHTGGSWRKIAPLDPHFQRPRLTSQLSPFAPIMDFGDDKYLDVCQNIEIGLKVAYERDSGLTD